MWELIRANQRKSFVLFVFMGIILLLLGYFVGEGFLGRGGGSFGILIAFAIWIVLTLVAYFSGGSLLMSISNAKEVTKSVHPQLYNVVEEMKIAANLPKMPKIYIINEEAPNAFATGRNPENCAVAVTAGLLAQMNRDELQGVIAHEMSHIKNRDILFMTFAGIMLGSIVLISEVFLRGMWFTGGSSRRYRSSSSEGGGQGQMIIMIVAIVFAILSPILAQLLYFAISRKREYLADASGARLTRYPEGLASALEKLSQNKYELKSANKVTAGMYIVNPLKKKGMKLSDLSSTHPPISERIKILRAMSQGAGFKDYQQAYSKVKSKRIDIIPASALKENEKVQIRNASKDDYKTAKSSKRKLGDIMMNVNNYLFLTCTCGLKMKVPPDYNKKEITCPRCGKVHEIPLEKLAAISMVGKNI